MPVCERSAFAKYKMKANQITSCPILEEFESKRQSILNALASPWATTNDLDRFIPGGPEAIAQALRDAMLPAVRIDGKRAFLVSPRLAHARLQLVGEFSPTTSVTMGAGPSPSN